MRMINIVFLVVMLGFFFLFGCFSDQSQKANKHYTEASKIMLDVINDDKGYEEKLKLYSDAKKNIDIILSKYSSSNIAVELHSGNTKISGLTVSEFYNLEGELVSKKLLFEAIANLKKINPMMQKFREILYLYSESKQKIVSILNQYPSSNVAIQLISGEKIINGLSLIRYLDLEESLTELAENDNDLVFYALSVTRKIKYAESKSRLIVNISEIYAEQNTELASQLLSEAYEIAKSIKKCIMS